MNITVEDINDTRKSVLVSIPATEISKEETNLLGEFGKQARIPGFRAGKAPVHMIKQRFKKQIAEELNRKIAGKAYETAVKESKLDVYSVVKVDGGDFASGEESEMTFTFDVRPEFELPKYEDIPVSIPSDEVTDAEFAAAKDHMLNQRAEYKEVEKAAEKGDYVKLSYEGKIGDQAVADLVPDQPIYGKQATTWEEAGAEEAPGVQAIIQGIVGMKKDDKKDVEEVFADDFQVEALQGKTVTYSLEVQEIREKILPEINEEFLKSLNVESEEKLDEQIRQDVEGQKKQQIDQEQRKQILDNLDGQVNFPVPESAIENERDILLKDYMARAMQQGATHEQLEERKEELYNGAQEAAAQRVKLQIILSEIAKKESINVENEDMSNRVMQEAMMTRQKPELIVKELKKDQSKLHEMQRDVLFNKTLAFLADKANVTTVEAGE